MAKINKREEDLKALWEWSKMADRLRALKFQESTLRKTLFAIFFPKPTEGTNKHELPAHYKLNGQYPIDRKVDEAAYTTNLKDLKAAKIPVDQVFKVKHDFSKSAYNKLSDEQKKLVDACLIVKPGSPSMTIVAPPVPEEEA